MTNESIQYPEGDPDDELLLEVLRKAIARKEGLFDIHELPPDSVLNFAGSVVRFVDEIDNLEFLLELEAYSNNG